MSVTVRMTTKGIVAEDPQAALKWYRKAVALGPNDFQKEIAAKSIRELTEKWQVEEEAGKKIAPIPLSSTAKQSWITGD